MKYKLFFLCIALSTSGLFAQKSKNKETKTESAKPFVLGVVDEFQSEILKEKRTVNIYLPEGYNPKDSVQYPVIYLLDGAANEDFIHISGLVQFYNFDWINIVPKSIVVGIVSPDRQRDLSFPTTFGDHPTRFPNAGGSTKFISFIEKELQPFIEKKYKGNNDKTLIGQSLGGLLASQVLIQKPQLFNRYIIVSPSLWWNNGTLLEESLANLEAAKTPIAVYLGVGKEGLVPFGVNRVMEVDANVFYDKLKTVKNEQFSVYFDYLPLKNHATILHQAVMNAFEVLYSEQVHE